MAASPLRRLPVVDDVAPSVDHEVWHTRGSVSHSAAVAFMVAATLVTDTFGAGVVGVAVGAIGLPGLVFALGRATGLHRRRWSLLLWPTSTLATLVALSRPASEASTLLVGLIVLAFLFVGLTQRRGMGLIGAPVGTVVFLVASDLTVPEASVRLPIALVVWIVVCEVPARLLDELRAREVTLREAATTDSLTGLLNRSDLDHHLGGLTSSSSLVLVDLDHFKRYNDEQGHVQGDVALTSFAAVLASHRRSGDLIYRFGGEEFLILLPLTEPSDALAVVERIARAWAETGLGMTFSGGVARGGPDAVERADAALYRAKHEGRDRVLLAEEPSVAADG